MYGGIPSFYCLTVALLWTLQASGSGGHAQHRVGKQTNDSRRRTLPSLPVERARTPCVIASDGFRGETQECVGRRECRLGTKVVVRRG